MALVLDAGGLIAFDRGDREVAALCEAARRRREHLRTSSGCVAQAWRDGGRQALLARLLAGVREFGLDPGASRAVGLACGASGMPDVVDAHLALLVADGDTVLTSDPDDLTVLLDALGTSADVRRC